MYKGSIILLCISIPSMILAQDCANLNTIEWILGEWQKENDKSVTTETWIKLSENTIDGKTITHSKKDSAITFIETLRLVEMSDHVFYIAKVSENDFPVLFKLTICSDSIAVFENPNHDFPTKFVYKLLDNGQVLNIEVSNDDRQFTIEYKKFN
jgi:hypothetical protein